MENRSAFEAASAAERTKQKMDLMERYKNVTLENIREEYECYRHFMNEYGPKLVGSDKFNGAVARKTPEQWMNISLEAFGLVTLENYHDKVNDYVEHKKLDTPAKYTVSGNAKRNQGYTKAGIKRHRDMYESIGKKRKESNAFGKKYLEEKREELEARGNRGKKRKLDSIAEREQGWVDAAGDWDDEEENEDPATGALNATDV